MKILKKILWIVYINAQALSFSCEASPHKISHPSDPVKQVEYFIKHPLVRKDKNPLILMIHGHQPTPRPGGKELFEGGVLDVYTQKGFIAVAVSQPGYGNSDGPPDFCGPFTQRAVIGVLDELKKRPDVNLSAIFIHGVSRGALVASMISTKDPSLAGVILVAGFYDLRVSLNLKFDSEGSDKISGMIANIKKEAGSSEEAMHERSAADYILQIKSPTLMFHGFNDDRVPVKQARDFCESLLTAGVAAQITIFPSGHHTPNEEKAALIDIFLKKRLESQNIL